MTDFSSVTRLLNHLEFVYRPGEQRLVLDLFALLGIQPGGTKTFLVGSIDRGYAEPRRQHHRGIRGGARAARIG